MPDAYRPAVSAEAIKVAHVATVDLSLRFLLLNQLESLREAGYAVTGISSEGSHVSSLADRGIRHIAVPMTRSITPIADLTALWRLYRIMRTERFTIVHCHTPKAELLGQLAARLAHVPVIVDTFRGIYEPPGSGRFQRWLIARLSHVAASCAHLVLFQSREALNGMRRQEVCQADRLAFLGNGIDVREFDRRRLNPFQLNALRKDLRLDSRKPVVGFVGRLVQEKGLVELFRAMNLVRAVVPDAQLLVVGQTDTDKPDAITTDMASRFGLHGACVFAGLRTDMPAVYGLMDVFVLPSHREGFPRVPMEAASMGLPCVVTNIPGCREVVEHGRNGLLVPVGEPVALADAIASLLTNRELSKRMGQAGRQKAVESFDEERVFATVKAVYARLLAEKGIVHPQWSSPIAHMAQS
jgi:glycosyltransferase involved in cell wall biosynthesis